jgi:polyhydroxybutyrate depolymerase
VVLAVVGCLACKDAPRKPAAETAIAEAAAMIEQARKDVETQAPAPPERDNQLFVPTGAEQAVPLLVFLHGLGGSGRGFSESLHLRARAQLMGFAFLSPQGAQDYSGRGFWNATDSCCNFDGLKVDHVGALRAWLASAMNNPAIDRRAVYLVGYSNGGFMAYRAACEMSDLLAGIFSIAGAGLSVSRDCVPLRPVSVVQVHGDSDPIVAYDGGLLFADSRRPPHPSARQSVERWAKLNGCDEGTVSRGHLDLDPRLPGGETQVEAFEGCNQSRVELWTVRGGDHSSGLGHNTLTALWAFVRADMRARRAEVDSAAR